MTPQRIRLSELHRGNPRDLDPLESLNAAWAVGFLRAIGFDFDELEADAARVNVTIRRAAWRDQYRAGIRAGRDARPGR